MSQSASVGARPRVSVLDADPDLGRWLRPQEITETRARVTASVLVLAPGFWDPAPPDGALSSHLGYLVLEGLLAREERIGSCAGAELLGPGAAQHLLGAGAEHNHDLVADDGHRLENNARALAARAPTRVAWHRFRSGSPLRLPGRFRLCGPARPDYRDGGVYRDAVAAAARSASHSASGKFVR